MKPAAPWSIRTHILLLVALASLPALCILLYTGLEQQRAASEAVDRMAGWQAYSLANLQERVVADTRQLLSVVAEIPQVKRQDAAACNEIFAELLRQNPRYDNILGTASNGDFYASGLPFFRHGAQDRRYFQEALRTRRFSAGNSVIARNSGRPTLHFALPVLTPAGAVQQVLVAGLDLTRIDPVFDRMDLPAGSSFMLVDYRGVVMRRVPGTPADAGRTLPDWPAAGFPDGNLVLRDAAGTATTYTCRNLTLPGDPVPYMTVLVNLPKAATLAAARWTLGRNLLLLAGALLLATIAALTAGNAGIAGPLHRLVAATRTLSEGQRQTPMDPRHAPRELVQLASAFNALSETSAQREAQRLQATEALRQSEERYRAVVANAPLGIFHFNDKGLIQECNDGFAAIFGTTKEDLIGFDLVHSMDHEEIRLSILEALCGRRGTYEGPFQPAGLGKPTQLRLLTYGINGSDGRFLGGVGIVENIAARHRAIQALKESEARYQGLFRNSPDCIFWIRVAEDGGFVVDSANPAQERATGLAAAAMVGQPLHAFLPSAQADRIEANYRRCVAERHSITYEDRAEGPTRSPVYQTLLVPLLDELGRVQRMVGISRDITQRKLTEEALLQAQKLESLGVLAGGIAHDFNNLLTAILGNLDLAVLKLSPESPALPFLEKAERTSLKASELTRQMLAYSGKGRFVVKPHDLNHLVEEMMHLLKVSISKRALLRYRLAPHLPCIEADSAQIQQVIMNLVTNASEAIDDKDGVINVTTEAVDLDPPFIQSAFANGELKAGRYVLLEVTDTGCGMSPAVLERIFDPFFTTKVSGRGLGLSAMLGILRGHRAGIRIASEEGRGSSIKIYFPAAQGVASPETAAPAHPASTLQGTVLLVDDEAVILETLAAALESMGFQVLTARDGQEAVERYQAASGEIDLVLMDLTMPRMDGREAFLAMRAIRPDVRVILSSGYNEQESVQQFIGTGLAGFIQKPYLLKDLRAVIQAKLEDGART